MSREQSKRRCYTIRFDSNKPWNDITKEIELAVRCMQTPRFSRAHAGDQFPDLDRDDILISLLHNPLISFVSVRESLLFGDQWSFAFYSHYSRTPLLPSPSPIPTTMPSPRPGPLRPRRPPKRT